MTDREGFLRRIRDREELASDLRGIDPNDDIKFQLVLKKGVELFDLSVKDIAHEFTTSIPTVERWLSGRNAPHPAIRPLIYKWLEDLAYGYYLEQI